MEAKDLAKTFWNNGDEVVLQPSYFYTADDLIFVHDEEGDDY